MFFSKLNVLQLEITKRQCYIFYFNKSVILLYYQFKKTFDWYNNPIQQIFSNHFFLEVQLVYTVAEVTGVQCSHSQFLKVILHLQLQNTGYIPCVEQYILVAYFIYNIAISSLPVCPSPFPLPADNRQFVLCTCESPSFCYIHQLVEFFRFQL